jgi:hypothetical protein
MLRKMALLVAIAFIGALTARAADVTGKWTAQVETPRGLQDISLDLKSDGNFLSGTITTERGITKLIDCKIHGGKLSFTQRLAYGGNEFQVLYTGDVVDSDTIDFVRKVRGMPEVEFTAKRVNPSGEN